MAKTQQTFRKRQRERRLREKAQLKRERRGQRRIEKKQWQASPAGPFALPAPLPEAAPAGAESDRSGTPVLRQP